MIRTISTLVVSSLNNLIKSPCVSKYFQTRNLYNLRKFLRCTFQRQTMYPTKKILRDSHPLKFPRLCPRLTYLLPRDNFAICNLHVLTRVQHRCDVAIRETVGETMSRPPSFRSDGRFNNVSNNSSKNEELCSSAPL